MNPNYAIHLSDETLANAMGVSPIKFENGKGNWPQEMEGASAVITLAMQEYANPNTVVNGAYVADRIVAHLREVISGGHEPQLHIGPWWANPTFSLAVALAKKTPTVWNQLSHDEIDRIDWVMRGYAVASNYGCNTKNEFTTGPELVGNYSKHWNPNYRSSNLTQIIACYSYFGSAEAVDDILVSFDYDEYIKVYTALGYTNIVTNWTKGDEQNGAGFVKRLMEEGAGKAEAPFTYLNKDGVEQTGGWGVGVKLPFTYWANGSVIPLADITPLFNTMLIHLYDSKVESAIGDAYFVDHAHSPFEGQMGMMREYNSKDAKGIRSDAGYCTHNFAMLVASTSAVILLGLWDPDDADNQALLRNTYVGNEDHIYRLTQGYYSFSHGKLAEKPSYEPAGVNVYSMTKSLWREYLIKFAPQSK